MSNAPKVLIYIAVISLVLGVLIKAIGFDFAYYGISMNYPIKPQSFLNFSNTVLLLSIALSLTGKKES